jgi:rubredoxin
MARFRCDVCKVYEYDPERGDSVTGLKPGTGLDEFPDGWVCPICLSDKTHLQEIPEEEEKDSVKIEETVSRDGSSVIHITHSKISETEGYLGEWRRLSDDVETHMADIHRMSASGESIVETLRSTARVFSWYEFVV